MSLLPDGLRFWRGFGLLIAGALLAVFVQAIEAVMLGRTGGLTPFLYLLEVAALAMLLLGPGWYWVGRPVYARRQGD